MTGDYRIFEIIYDVIEGGIFDLRRPMVATIKYLDLVSVNDSNERVYRISPTSVILIPNLLK